MTKRTELAAIADSVESIETHLAAIAGRPAGLARDEHFHAGPLLFERPDGLDIKARLEEQPAGYREALESKLAPSRIVDPAARVAVLTVARRLKEVADVSEPITGAEIRDLGFAYERIQELFNLVGRITPEEERHADDLIIDLLTPAPTN